ncbi:MAG: peptide deformylase [Symbiobacterium sp.]|uniref:peptide deformylase n=1 Tax=Symbiobacterium sp. TaxID=1971213 RepID=UPI003463D99B
MAILEIVKDPAEVLRKKAKPVTKINASIRKLLDDMTETMYAAPGVGLAAPQVGVSKRIIVVDPQDGSGQLYQLINPEITRAEGWVKGTEGCLSIPGMVGDVWRYEKVQVVGLDRHGKKVWIDAEGWLARIFQHEIDHLDGILYTDKCENLRPVEEGEEESAEVAEGPVAEAEPAAEGASSESAAGAGATAAAEAATGGEAPGAAAEDAEAAGRTSAEKAPAGGGN